jgi:hypothetical protein
LAAPDYGNGKGPGCHGSHPGPPPGDVMAHLRFCRQTMPAYTATEVCPGCAFPLAVTRKKKEQPRATSTTSKRGSKPHRTCSATLVVDPNIFHEGGATTTTTRGCDKIPFGAPKNIWYRVLHKALSQKHAPPSEPVDVPAGPPPIQTTSAESMWPDEVRRRRLCTRFASRAGCPSSRMVF